MQLPGNDLTTLDAGAVLLRLIHRVQALRVGSVMASEIRDACESLPFVVAACVELPGGAVAGDAQRTGWTYRYDIDAGSGRLGTIRVWVSEKAGFAPTERMLRDAVGALGLGIAHSLNREPGDRQSAAGRSDPAAVERDRVENARLAEIVRRSVNPIYVLDLEFRLVWANQVFLDTFGLTWSKAVGRRPSAVLYADQRMPRHVTDIQAALAADGAFSGEVANRDRFGREKIFALRMDRFRSDDGQHEGYVAIREDITERRHAERGLAESELRFRDLTETASDWFWETDSSHRLLSLTGAWPRPTDGREDRVGQRRWDFALGDPDSEAWRRHRDDLENRRSFRDFRYVIAGSGPAPVHVSISGRPVYDADGQFTGYRGTGRDITDEVTARETVDSLVRALDSIEDLVALFDADERLVFANRPYRAMHPALDTVLVPGRTMSQILEDFATYGIIEDPETAIPLRLRQFRSPAGPVDMQRSGRWYRAKDQKLQDGGTLLIATDVTNSKEAEFDLRQAVDAAEEANTAKSAFLARMSHELRTPLNAILGLSETLILMEDRLSPAKRREYLGDVMQAGRILLSHIDDILHFTRLDADGFAVNPQSVDPRRVAAEVVRLMRAVARSRSIRLEAAIARDLPNVLVDPRSARQVLINLLSNAVKFSPRSGVVQLVVVRDGDRLRFSVVDHGIGIPANQIDRIFEPFHQVGNPAHALREGGTGLGLSIVKGLVERNHGAVAVDSREGEGTTISVWFPMVAESASPG